MKDNSLIAGKIGRWYGRNPKCNGMLCMAIKTEFNPYDSFFDIVPLEKWDKVWPNDGNIESKSFIDYNIDIQNLNFSSIKNHLKNLYEDKTGVNMSNLIYLEVLDYIKIYELNSTVS